ncbi:MAG TPA: methyltransferase, TIGR04325 family [Lacunisphaera sp.]|nr:methyltransferase, TIGR04325 family [Lacunisphaera sp.]
MKRLARLLLPPFLYEAVRWCVRPAARRPRPEPIRFTGNYASWEEARRASSGYDAPEILARTRAAILQVKNGTAVFERDGLLLPEPEPPLPLLAWLQRIALENHGRLHVLDFGGSLGSTYFQCREFLAPLDQLRWCVVEQPAHVACGRREFADDRLSFHLDLDEAIRSAPPDVLLLSGVLAYLPDPAAFLTDALARDIPHVILDRTFFHSGPRPRLTVQQVPAWIHPASYPAWFLTEKGLQEIFSSRYECVAALPAHDHPELPEGTGYARGFVFRRR